MALEVAELITKLVMDSTSFTSGVEGAITKSKTMGEKVAGASLAIGGSIEAVGGLVEHLGAKIETAHLDMENAIKNTGADYDALKGKIGEAIAKGQEFGHSTGDTQEAIAKLTTRTGDAVLAIKDMNVVNEVAAAKHISLTEAADVVGKILQGNTKVMKQFGITTTDVKDAIANGGSATDILGQKLKGFAESQAETFHGKMEALKVKVEDFAGAIGQKVGPALVMAGPLLMGIGQIIPVVTGAWGFLNTVILANPIGLFIAGAVLLVGAFILLYQHCDAFREIVQTVFGVVLDVITGVWDWVSSNWPLLLAILTGPIGLAVLVIHDHWDSIKNGFTAVKDWIGNRIGDIVGFITGIPGRISSAASTMWDGIKDAFIAVFEWIKSKITDIPGLIKGAVGGVLNSIPGAGLVKSIGGLFGFAEGGTVPGPVGAPMMAMVHGGERVIPVGGGGSGGGTVYNINVSGALDADGTARAIQKILLDLGRRTGSLGFT